MYTLPIGIPPWICVEWKTSTYPEIEQNRYMISNHGLVYDTIKNEYKYQYTHWSGHKTISSLHNTIGVHRLVAWEFCNPPENYYELDVNHIDGNPSNNFYTNLEWVTYLENRQHAAKIGLTKKGEDHPHSKITEEIARQICQLIQDTDLNNQEIAEKFNIPKAIVMNIRTKRTWTHVSKDYDISRINGYRLTEEEVKTICKGLEENKSYKEIADDLGLELTGTLSSKFSSIRSGDIYKNISQNYNIDYKQNREKYSDDFIRRICEFIQEGKSYKEIANDLGFEYSHNFQTFLTSIKTGKVYSNISKDYDFSKIDYNRSFTEEKVRDICERLELNMPYKNILKEVGLEESDKNLRIISNIRRRKSYKDIGSEYNFQQNKHPLEKLNDITVKEICEYLELGISTDEILTRLGIEKNNNTVHIISNIRQRITYKDISKDYNF